MDRVVLKSFTTLFFFLSAFIAPPGAMAGFIGNPMADIATDNREGSVIYDMVDRDYDSKNIDSDRITLKVSFGIEDDLNVYGMLGHIDVDPGDSENGFGAGLKKNIDLSNREWGFTVQAMEYLSDLDLTVIDIALGTSEVLGPGLAGYLGGLLSFENGAKDVDADNNLGIFGGIEYAPTKQLTLGGELRLLSEVSIGLVATFAF